MWRNAFLVTTHLPRAKDEWGLRSLAERNRGGALPEEVALVHHLERIGDRAPIRRPRAAVVVAGGAPQVPIDAHIVGAHRARPPLRSCDLGAGAEKAGAL